MNSKTTRFSKARVLKALARRAAQIAQRQKFNRSKGTSQLDPKLREFDEAIRRAVDYGRMRALEEFACSIEEGFAFDDAATPS